MEDFITMLSQLSFKLSDFEQQMLHSTFQLFKGNIAEKFKLLDDLIISLPHFPSCQCHQWDIASFLKATTTLTLATYNTIQISKLDATIEAQQHKTELLTDITKLH
jgi:hypothetical protein